MNAEQREELFGVLKARFEKNMKRHMGLEWSKVEARLEASPEKLRSLSEMERTGGEPDVVGYDEETGESIFCDCSPESPIGRRSICYDREALDSRKENKPSGNAIEMASSMGIEILTGQQYRELQELGEFERKTSSWVETPSKIRDLGGALFCDRRYDHVFVYHNGAQDIGPLHIPIAQAAVKAKLDNHWRYRELNTGHMPMWTAPQELVTLLLELT